jgi:hypothetical protein
MWQRYNIFLGTKVTKQNRIHKEIKVRLIYGTLATIQFRIFLPSRIQPNKTAASTDIPPHHVRR